MKEKPNEWIVISDLMAGVVAIVMLLLIVSVVQQAYAEIKHKQEMEKGIDAQRKMATKVLKEMKQSFLALGIGDLVEFDMVTHLSHLIFSKNIQIKTTL